MKRRLQRVATTAVSLVLLSAALVLPAHGTCSSEPTNDWASIEVTFPSGGEEIVDYEVSPSDGMTILATNGRAVVASRDGGCSFESTLDLESATFSYDVATARITDLSVRWGNAPLVHVALVAYPDPRASIPRPHVLASPNAGRTWTEIDSGLDGLDVVGLPLQVGAAPTDPERLYLLTDEFEVDHSVLPEVATSKRLFTSVDGGQSWSIALADATPLPRLERVNGGNFHAEGFVIDPVQPDELWLYGPDGAAHWTVGDATPRYFDPPPPPAAGGIDVLHEGPQTHIVTFGANRPSLRISADAGLLWTSLPTAGIVNSAVFSPLRTEWAYSLADGSVYYVIDGVKGFIDISHPTKSIADLRVPSVGERRVVFGRTSTTIERRLAPLRPSPPPATKIEKVDREPQATLRPLPAGVELERPRLIPNKKEIVLRPGETRSVPFRLQLPGIRMVDVAFLTDLSGSMEEEIAGLRDATGQIIVDLVEEGIHAHFGVAGYRNYADGPAYRRFLNISPPGESLRDALEQLQSGGQGQEETALTALYQLATGDGQDEPLAEGGRAYVAGGQQMDFRPGALHVVVHASDEAFTEGPPRPSYEEASAALRAVQALQVGLAFQNDLGTDPFNPVLSGPPDESLSKIAEGTYAFAPQQGVDCDADGTVDVLAFAPLVCPIPANESDLASSIGTAIVSIVNGLEEVRDVVLEVDGREDVHVDVTPTRQVGIDFKLPQQVAFKVRVTCPRAPIEVEDEMTVRAFTRSRAVADPASLKVTCRPTLPVPPRDPATPGKGLAVPAPLPVPPPPIARVPELGSSPQMSHNLVQQMQAQTQSQGQAQSVLLLQEQEQPQLAAVHAQQPNVQLNLASQERFYSMLRFSPRRTHYSNGLYAAGYVAASVIAIAFGFAFGHRARSVPIRTERQASGGRRRR